LKRNEEGFAEKMIADVVGKLRRNGRYGKHFRKKSE
jgi:hypothetical protein